MSWKTLSIQSGKMDVRDFGLEISAIRMHCKVNTPYISTGKFSIDVSVVQKNICSISVELHLHRGDRDDLSSKSRCSVRPGAAMEPQEFVNL